MDFSEHDKDYIHVFWKYASMFTIQLHIKMKFISLNTPWLVDLKPEIILVLMRKCEMLREWLLA